MRRLTALVGLLALVALGGGALTASPARAVPPERDRFTFNDTFEIPAGEICDFDLRFTFDFRITEVRYFDQEGNLLRVVDHINGSDTDTNLNTGATLTNDDHFITTFDAQTETIAYRGLNLHIRTPDGKLIAVLAGRMTFDATTGDLLSVTPHMGGGLPVTCRLLGGNPA